MTSQSVRDPASESKVVTRLHRKFWFAVCSDMFGHEVVGAHVKSPKPADPKRQAWQPFVAWQWLIKEAARHERQRVIKGRAIPLRRGQLAVSLRYFAREANWGVKAVRLFFERLETFKMISIQGHGTETVPVTSKEQATPKKGTPLTVLTICNYDTYQSAPDRGGTQRAQQGHSRGTAGAQDSTERQGRQRDREDHHPSNHELKDDDRAKPLQLSPSIVRTLAEHVSEERSAELVREYLASDYARNAKVLDKAFIGWLRKTYGVVISGAGNAVPTLGQVLDMCPKDACGRAITALPDQVSGDAGDWRARARVGMHSGGRA